MNLEARNWVASLINAAKEINKIPDLNWLVQDLLHWGEQEDNLLLESVWIYGQNWTKVADSFDHKYTESQWRERYFSTFSTEEESSPNKLEEMFSAQNETSEPAVPLSITAGNISPLVSEADLETKTKSASSQEDSDEQASHKSSSSEEQEGDSEEGSGEESFEKSSQQENLNKASHKSNSEESNQEQNSENSSQEESSPTSQRKSHESEGMKSSQSSTKAASQDHDEKSEHSEKKGSEDGASAKASTEEKEDSSKSDCNESVYTQNTEPHMDYNSSVLKIYGPRTLNNVQNITLDQVFQNIEPEDEDQKSLKRYAEEKSKITPEHAIKIAHWLADRKGGIKGLSKQIPEMSEPNLILLIKEEMDPQFLKFTEFTKFDLFKMIKLYEKFGDEKFDKIIPYFNGQGSNFLRRCLCRNLHSFALYRINSILREAEKLNIQFLFSRRKKEIRRLKKLTPWSPLPDLLEIKPRLLDRLRTKYPGLENSVLKNISEKELLIQNF